MTEAILSVRDLTVVYPRLARPAVRAFSVEVGRRESVAIVGESGSGKSTVALAVTHLLPPTAKVLAARLELEGRELRRMGPRELRRYRGLRVGMVFQDPTGSWNPARTIGAQLTDGLRATGFVGDVRARLVELLDQVGIRDAGRRINDYPHQFSGGMLQRAMIAGALANRPAMLIADEPTSALDSTVQAELLQLLAEIRSQADLSLVTISHNLGVVARIAEKTLVMYAGDVVEHGATDTLFRRPAHPYTWGLMASVPSMDGPRKVPLPTLRAGGVASHGCPFAPRCPLAANRCREERPLLRSHNGRLVACHRAEEVPEALEGAA